MGRAIHPCPPYGRVNWIWRPISRWGSELAVPLNEWCCLMHCIGDTYLAVLRPWSGFLNERGYQWNARTAAVREYTRLFLIDAGRALQAGRSGTGASSSIAYGCETLQPALNSSGWHTRKELVGQHGHSEARLRPWRSPGVLHSESPGVHTTVMTTGPGEVVLDTNVFVAGGFNPGSHSARLVQAVRDGGCA